MDKCILPVPAFSQDPGGSFEENTIMNETHIRKPAGNIEARPDKHSGHGGIFHRGILTGFVALTAIAMLPAINAPNLKEGDNFGPAYSVGAEAAHAQTTEGDDTMEEKNKEIISKAFADWANGTGSFFDLLDENAEWTITGSSPISKTYTSRQQFLDEAITPINERLSARIVPKVRGIYADGDMVVVLWDGTATAKDGTPYNNTYSWFMTMKDGRIVEVVAFFDTIDFTEFWNRITPEKAK